MIGRKKCMVHVKVGIKSDGIIRLKMQWRRNKLSRKIKWESLMRERRT